MAQNAWITSVAAKRGQQSLAGQLLDIIFFRNFLSYDLKAFRHRRRADFVFTVFFHHNLHI